MQRGRRSALVEAVLALALALTPLAAAQAHAKLVGSNPPAGAAVAPIARLDLNFSEAISAKLSGVELSDASGARATTASRLAPGAPKTLAVTIAHPLKPGVYTVAWHAVASDDGHRTQGTFSFTVR